MNGGGGCRPIISIKLLGGGADEQNLSFTIS